MREGGKASGKEKGTTVSIPLLLHLLSSNPTFTMSASPLSPHYIFIISPFTIFSYYFHIKTTTTIYHFLLLSASSPSLSPHFTISTISTTNCISPHLTAASFTLFLHTSSLPTPPLTLLSFPSYNHISQISYSLLKQPSS